MRTWFSNWMLSHLRLPVFEFRAYLVGLRESVAQRNVQGQPDALIGRGGIDELVQSAAVADGVLV